MMFNAFPVVGGQQLERREREQLMGQTSGQLLFPAGGGGIDFRGAKLSLSVSVSVSSGRQFITFHLGIEAKSEWGNNNCNSNTISPPPKNSLKGPAKNYQIYVERRY